MALYVIERFSVIKKFNSFDSQKLSLFSLENSTPKFTPNYCTVFLGERSFQKRIV